MSVKTILVCGDRNWVDFKTMERFFDSIKEPFQIVEGGCRGADDKAQYLAHKRGVTVFEEKADWATYGKMAGPIRNQLMLDKYKPDLVVAFHNDIEHSKGTKDMLERAKRQGFKTKLITTANEVDFSNYMTEEELVRLEKTILETNVSNIMEGIS